ncbi:hypothetical protein OBBRIDRAFT_788932 [Obba rivulosa]|uniref:Armadillo-like helical domain-containing protein n=1 Tax=Obba rivulosa TaxID=1052685 RepID=A0A8E2DS35_9APHY|nr:hypothetical protein OBBRIDRAFT_788932 [Obba rivulosa]
MELFAGGVKDSDRVFSDLTATLAEILGDNNAPASCRHAVLQLAVILVCGISQLSPGAYFLRRDLFPCIVAIITCPETERYTFEAVLLLSLLANFHKSDAGRLNPYLKRIRETTDNVLMRKICWASNFVADAAVKAYQKILDDSPPTIGSALGLLFSSLRPDRALSSKPLDLSRELFKDQPIEACVVLLPIFEFSHANGTFRSAIIEPLDQSKERSKEGSPLAYTLLTLFSYILSHASSSSSARAIAYANLSLNILLIMVEDEKILSSLCSPSKANIRMCRQRPPLLPAFLPRAPICAVLDCVLLWLRHNLHKRLEVHSYIVSIRVASHVVWVLHKEHSHLEYYWQELWRALLGMLDFLSNKLDSLITTGGGIEQLVKETLWLLDDSLYFSDDILPSPRAVHGLVYELVHSVAILRKLRTLLDKVAIPSSPTRKRASSINDRTQEALTNILATTDYYENKIKDAGVQSATDALRLVAREIDQNGLNYNKDHHQGSDPPSKQGEEVVGFIRYAYLDGMSLMP